MRKKMKCVALLSLALCLLLAGCAQSVGSTTQTAAPAEDEAVYIDEVTLAFVNIEDEAVALAASAPAIPKYLSTKQGDKTKDNGKAVIDYSYVADGYVTVKYTASTSQRLKALVNGPTTQYQYNIEPGKWVSLPLSDGNGTYKIGIYENVKGSSYATVVSTSVDVKLSDEFAPFLRSNQYVDFESAPETIAKADELCKGISDKEPLQKVAAVYKYVVDTLTYDTELAATVKSGYLPVLDTVLSKKTGICFDYAALMTGMLRSQGIPCKLVIGYAGTAYHAWISVWSEESGWIENVIEFDGVSWKRMDPTFASSSNRSASIMEYIGDGENYSAKYFY